MSNNIIYFLFFIYLFYFNVKSEICTSIHSLINELLHHYVEQFDSFL